MSFQREGGYPGVRGTRGGVSFRSVNLQRRKEGPNKIRGCSFTYADRRKKRGKNFVPYRILRGRAQPEKMRNIELLPGTATSFSRVKEQMRRRTR